MLEPNRLAPPRPYSNPVAAEPSAVRTHRGGILFVSPEDFDGTGILAGFDPCASIYWWMPELHATAMSDLARWPNPKRAETVQATRRTSARPQAAA